MGWVNEKEEYKSDPGRGGQSWSLGEGKITLSWLQSWRNSFEVQSSAEKLHLPCKLISWKWEAQQQSISVLAPSKPITGRKASTLTSTRMLRERQEGKSWTHWIWWTHCNGRTQWRSMCKLELFKRNNS